MGALTNTDLMYEAFSEDLFYANIAEWVYWNVVTLQVQVLILYVVRNIF